MRAARRETAKGQGRTRVGRLAWNRLKVRTGRLVTHRRRHQSHRIGMARPAQQFGNRASLDEASGIHHCNLVGDLGRHRQIVRHKDHRHAQLALQGTQ